MGVTCPTIVTNDNKNNDDDDDNAKDESIAPVAVTTTMTATSTTIFGLSDDQIKVTVGGENRRGVAVVEWDASLADNVIADAVVALVIHAQASAASI